MILDDPAAVTNPFYLLAPTWARLPAGRAGHGRDRHRVAGGDLRRVLGVAAGGAAGLPAAPDRAPHVDASRAARSTCPPSTGCCSAGVLVLMLVFQSSTKLATRLRAGGDRHPPPHHHAVPHVRGHRVAVGDVEAGAGRGRVRRRRAHLPRRQPHQDRRGRVAAAARRGDRRHRDDHLAARQADHHRPPHRRRRPAAGVHRRCSTREQIPRVPGTAVFPHPTKLTAPLALRANVAFNHVLHERVVIVSVLSENVPHVPLGERLAIDELGDARRRHPAPLGAVRVPGRAGPPGGAAAGLRPVATSSTSTRTRPSTSSPA